jgi:hypothetical protein
MMVGGGPDPNESDDDEGLDAGRSGDVTMPADSHARHDVADVRTVLDLVTSVLGLELDGAETVALAEVEVEDDLTVLHLWSAVVEELGDRSCADFEPPDPLPATLGELVTAFHEALPLVTAALPARSARTR